MAYNSLLPCLPASWSTGVYFLSFRTASGKKSFAKYYVDPIELSAMKEIFPGLDHFSARSRRIVFGHAPFRVKLISFARGTTIRTGIDDYKIFPTIP